MKHIKHTPAPWKIAEPKGNGTGHFIWRNNGDTGRNTGYARICQHVHNTADARLIAAAPDLLEACKETLKQMQGLYDLVNEVGVNDADGFYLGHAKDVIKKMQAAIAKAQGAEHE